MARLAAFFILKHPPISIDIHGCECYRSGLGNGVSLLKMYFFRKKLWLIKKQNDTSALNLDDFAKNLILSPLRHDQHPKTYSLDP